MSRWIFSMTTLALDNRIRNANLLDLAELSRLLSSAAHTIANYLSHGHMLVLERRDGTLQAACHVDMHADHSTIDLLVVDPANHDGAVRERMVGVANALCEAYGHPEPALPATRSRGRR